MDDGYSFPPAPKKSHATLWKIAAVALTVAIIGGAAVHHQNTQRAQKVAAAAAVIAVAKAKTATEVKACQDGLTPTVTALADIDSRLTVGMTEPDFTTAVGDAQVAYGRVNTATLSASCVSAVVPPIESALGSYRDAASTWNACVLDYYCDASSRFTDDQLQTDWSSATTSISDAKIAIATGGTAVPQ